MSYIFNQVLKEGTFAPSKGRFGRVVEDASLNPEGMENGSYLLEAKGILNGKVFKQEIDFAIAATLDGMNKDNYERCEAMAEALASLYCRFEQLAERHEILDQERQNQIQATIGIEEDTHLPPEIS